MSHPTLTPEHDAVVAKAARVAPHYAAISQRDRAQALVAVADALEAHREELVALAAEETGLTTPRLTGELSRTATQLRFFADVVSKGEYHDARIDERDDGFVLGVRPDLRRMLVPLGPVINFTASNFPFAFSVAGGDTASILAAGCPVIVKAHSGHPKLSDATAQIVSNALESSGMPDGVFQLIHGQQAGVEILKDARVKAGSFTGSIYAGRILADIAASKAAPSPFFGELGSVNPVFITAQAMVEHRETIPQGYVTSVAGSAGQLCTKPGIVFVPTGHDFDAAISEAARDVPEHRMLNPRIAQSYAERRDEILATPGVRVIAEGAVRRDDAGQGWVTPTIVAFSLQDFRAGQHTLSEEAFGPLSILVEVEHDTDLASLMPEFFEGNLTATVHVGTDESQAPNADTKLKALIHAMATQAGRVLFNSWPTGVAVTHAMQHGGPWPATTNDSSTSVGSAAISRFLRPVAYQDAPATFLPDALRDDNPLSVPQSYSPAGESTQWGESVS